MPKFMITVSWIITFSIVALSIWNGSDRPIVIFIKYLSSRSSGLIGSCSWHNEKLFKGIIGRLIEIFLIERDREFEPTGSMDQVKEEAAFV